jgi:hypothetical protein
VKIRNFCEIAGAALVAAGSLTAQNAALTSFVDSHGVEYVFYEDANRNIQELYNNGAWRVENPNPTAVAGAPATAPGSALSSFFDSFGIQHVFYYDADRNVHELYNNGRWWKTS